MEYAISNLLQKFERGSITRRQLIQGLVLTASVASGTNSTLAAPQTSDGTKLLQATGMVHVSYMVHDYAKIRDFYADLFGMKVTMDDGKQCRMSVGNNILIPRNAPFNTPRYDHISYAIAGWDKNKEAIGEELKRRGLNPFWNGQTAYHFRDPEGMDIEIQGEGGYTGPFRGDVPGEKEFFKNDPTSHTEGSK
jgi:catechol 2,3-dioxygenase-like lactoylglutathione lyase family enzyme